MGHYGRKQGFLTPGYLWLSVCDSSAFETLLSCARRVAPFLQGRLFREVTSSGSFPCFSWSLCCFIFDPPKLHRFPCMSDMQQLCSAQALCWIRSETWWCSGATVLLKVRLGKVALKRRHYHNACLVTLFCFGNVHLVTHGTPDLTSIYDIASLHSASQLWPAKFLGSFCKMFYKYVTLQNKNVSFFALIWSFFHHSGQNLFLFLTGSIPFTRTKVHSKGNIRQSTGEHDELAHKAIFTSKWTNISPCSASQKPR